MSYLLDANVIIRYFVADDPKKAQAFENLLKEGREELFVTSVTVAEIVWVLSSFYKLSKKSVIEKIEGLLNLDSVEVENQSVISRSLEIWRNYNIDFIDAYTAAFAEAGGFDGIYSYDRSLDRIKSLSRREP